jgi:hypothetical protein
VADALSVPRYPASVDSSATMKSGKVPHQHEYETQDRRTDSTRVQSLTMALSLGLTPMSWGDGTWLRRAGFISSQV